MKTEIDPDINPYKSSMLTTDNMSTHSLLKFFIVSCIIGFLCGILTGIVIF